MKDPPMPNAIRAVWMIDTILLSIALVGGRG